MLRSRIIPCLLVHKRGLVKSIEFKNYKYVGDPINAVKIFNEKEVDELMVLDIDASANKREPDFEMIKNLAVECRMPFCYGGGITTVEQAKKIIRLGAEKVALNTQALINRSLLGEIGKAVGFQSVVVIIDVKKKILGGYDIYYNNGKTIFDTKLKDYLESLNQIGVGEIVINSIDKDGTESGYDYTLIDFVRATVDMPISVLGGAGSLSDLKKTVERYKVIGVAAGSIFVFKGRYKAVLINYPNKKEKQTINETNHSIF